MCWQTRGGANSIYESFSPIGSTQHSRLRWSPKPPPSSLRYICTHRRVQLGRKTNKSPPFSKNEVYFDSRVVSRHQAEVWQEGGKMFICDLNSSNGTFVNGRRLSPEGLPREIKTDDVLELGIDITEYNDAVAHRKIVCRIVCVFTQVNSTNHWGNFSTNSASKDSVYIL